MLKVFILFTSVIITLFTCNKPPCICDFDQRLGIDVKIVDNNGHDLVLGVSSIYKFDSLDILNKLNDFSVSNASVDPAYYHPNSIAFNFHIPAPKSYIYYGQGIQQDSLQITWVTKTGKCCNSSQDYLEVGAVKFNNQVIIPQNGVYYFVK